MYGELAEANDHEQRSARTSGAAQSSRGRSGDGAGFDIAVAFKVGTIRASARGRAPMASKAGNIYIGIGGWTFAPWCGVFYPEKLAQAKELAYAASKLTSIEIN